MEWCQKCLARGPGALADHRIVGDCRKLKPEQVRDLGERHACALERMLQFWQGARPPYVDEQLRLGRGDHVVVGGIIADVDDVWRS